MKEQMTDEQRRQLVAYRLQNSVRALDDARLLLTADSVNAAVNRLYYACFYAVNALLVHDRHEFGTHHGAKVLLGRHYIATDRLSRAHGTFYGKLFNARNEGDYDAFVYFDRGTVEEYLAQTHEFVEAVKREIDKEM